MIRELESRYRSRDSNIIGAQIRVVVLDRGGQHGQPRAVDCV